jgi:uncharacterized protein YjbJ (UPF0337 family)
VNDQSRQKSLNRFGAKAAGVVALVGERVAAAVAQHVRGHFSGPERSDVSDVDHGKFGNTGAAIMGSTADKASGLANEAAGKAKQGIGNVVGSDKLKAEGAAQELKGDAQKATGDAKAAVKDAANQTAKAINKNL